MIPEAAVEAAAEWLPHSGDCEVRPERDCTCWKARVDLMRIILEAAAPHMLAECWEASAKATADYELEYRVSFDFGDDLPEPPANPYRPTP